MIGLVPHEILEILLFAALIAVFLVIAHAVRRRHQLQPLAADGPLPSLTTDVRVSITVRRIFRDLAQGVWLVEADSARGRITFCAVDYEIHTDAYQAGTGRETTAAVYALGTVAAGGIEALHIQIIDFDRAASRPDQTLFQHAGEFSNDYAFVGRIESTRGESIECEPVCIYCIAFDSAVDAKVEKQYFLEVAVDAANGDAFDAGDRIHGAARLYGYLIG